jgi:hypothetical protein
MEKHINDKITMKNIQDAAISLIGVVRGAAPSETEFSAHFVEGKAREIGLKENPPINAKTIIDYAIRDGRLDKEGSTYILIIQREPDYDIS